MRDNQLVIFPLLRPGGWSGWPGHLHFVFPKAGAEIMVAIQQKVFAECSR